MSSGKLKIIGNGEILFGQNYSEPQTPEFGYVSLYSQDGQLRAKDWEGQVEIFGSSGSSGSSGQSGTNGTSGLSGSFGTSGSSGQTGSSGTSGQSGTNGTSGNSGTNGTSGENGSSGSSGQSGTSGSSGSTGTSGSSGSTGTSGSSGVSGSVYYSTSSTSLTLGNGTQTLIVGTNLQFTPTQDVTILYPSDPLSYNMTGVIAGYDSNDGELIVNVYQTVGSGTFADWIVNLDGAIGAAGSSGTSGANGSSGTSGENGSSGTSGANGSSGTSGESGTSGVSGSSGSSGSSGQTGSSGTSGQSGSSGTSGENGSSGSSGQSGSSGSSGTSGESGTSGTSGQNGISAGRVYYFNESQNSDVSPYKVLSDAPTATTQQTVSKTLTGNEANVLVQEFLTPELGYTVIPAGVQRFKLYYTISPSAADIDTYVTLELADSAGTGYGTVVTSSPVKIQYNDGQPSETDVDIVFPSTAINADDRMIVKLYLTNLDGVSRTVVWSTENGYYSYVITSVGVVAGTSGSSGSSGQSGSSGSSGTSGTSQAGLNFTAVFSGGGAVITPGVITYIRAPRTCTITKVTLLADQTGSAVLDIYKDDYANFPPTALDSITASAKPTLSSANKYEDSTLTGWTTSITAGQVLGFTIDSCSTIEQITLQLETA